MALLALAVAHSAAPWKNLKVIQHDVIFLYEYLPALFIYGDLSFAFTDRLPKELADQIWLRTTDTGARVPKMTAGAALLYAPFFLAAHLTAILVGIPANGYSWIYHYFIVLGAITYAITGLILLRRLLLATFSDTVVAITLVSIFAATNLLYYTTIESGMTHAYSFFLFALWLRLTAAWHARPQTGTALALGATLGLLTLVRPSNVVVALVFLLYLPDHLGTWRQKLDLLRRNSIQLVPALVAAALVLSPQLAYWKYFTGSWLYYSYGDETFFFSRPHIIDGLFSYRKGLLVYTPVMALAFAGFALLWTRARPWFWSVTVFTAVNLYVVFSWWCWWYGGSFGSRALIESYAIWALPLAAIYARLLSSRPSVKTVAIAVVGMLAIVNLFQTWQYRRTLIHWDSMTQEAYWSVFLSRRRPLDYEQKLRTPDYERAQRGEREYGAALTE